MIRIRAAAFALCLAVGCGPDAPPPSSSKKATSGAGFPSLSDMLVIEIVHSEAYMCAFRTHSEVCRDDAHWRIALNRRESPEWPPAIAFIQSEAKRLANPKQPGVSMLRPEIAAVSGAPYGPIRKALEACAAAGIGQFTFTEFKEKLVDWKASALGVGVGTGLVLFIGKRETSEKVRWVAPEELQEAIDAATSSRKDVRIVIRPLESTVWGEVMGIRDACRKGGYSLVEFAVMK
jgi:hypothetical protein